jgi:cation diffusion facilitator family transporter
VIGFVGNEAVAVFRIRVGKEIGSAALVADGYHARVDGLTSLAVLLGAIGLYLGYPLADPIVGVGITIAILNLVRQSAQAVFLRMLDGVEPGVLEAIRRAAAHVPGVQGVTAARARWVGHRLHAEVTVAVAPDLSVAQGRQIALEVHQSLRGQISYLGHATISLDPAGTTGGSPLPLSINASRHQDLRPLSHAAPGRHRGAGQPAGSPPALPDRPRPVRGPHQQAPSRCRRHHLWR